MRFRIVLSIMVAVLGVIVLTELNDESSQADDDQATLPTTTVQNLSEFEQNTDADETNANAESFANIDIPPLPFADNLDPTQCGIPTAWGGTNNIAWLNGYYDGELIRPTVYLYDSHARQEILATAPHGTEVEIVMFQANPTLNYYFVRIPDAPAGQNQGWVPAPFLSREPLAS